MIFILQETKVSICFQNTTTHIKKRKKLNTLYIGIKNPLRYRGYDKLCIESLDTPMENLKEIILHHSRQILYIHSQNRGSFPVNVFYGNICCFIGLK